MTRPGNASSAKAFSRMSQRRSKLRSWIIWTAKYAVSVVRANILIIGILVVLLEASYLRKFAGVIAASVR